MAAAWQRDMQNWVQAGRIGDRLPPEARLNAPRRIERGRVAPLRWEATRADSALLRILAPGGAVTEEAVRLAGERRVEFQEIGQHQITLIATAAAPRVGRRRRRAAVQAQAYVDVVFPKPTVTLDVAGSSVLFETLEISWEVTDAREVHLAVDGEVTPVASVGSRVVRPDQLGPYEIGIEAVGDGGRAGAARRTRIVAPPVVFDVPEIVAGEPGDIITVDFSISGAKDRFLDRKDPFEPVERLPAKGTIEIQATCEPERFQLIATGFDDRSYAKTVTVEPLFVAFPDIADDLALLDRRL